MADGALLVTSFDRHSIYCISPDQKTIRRLVGLGRLELSKPIGQNSDEALAIEMDQPHEVRVDESGNMYVADTRNHRIGRIDAKTMQWTTIAGTGTPGFSGDGGAADQAQLNGPHSLALNDSTIYIADLANHRIRAIDRKTNIIRTVAGTGEKAMPANGAIASSQPLSGPRSLAIDSDNLWIALREGNSIWRLDFSTGKLEHIAGTSKAGKSGDGGLATKAELNGPKGIAVDPGVAIYIVDTENHKIRMVDLSSRLITTVAGDVAGTRGALARPHGIAFVPGKGFIVGDSENHRVVLFSKK